MKDSKKNFWRFFNVFGPPILIILAVFSFFWKTFLLKEIPIPGDFVVGVYYPWLDYKWGFVTGVPVKNPLTTDVVSYTFPMQTLAVELLKKGELPLWNPYILAGTPLLANFQSAPFSPTNFLYLFLDKLSAWSIQVVLQHVLVAIFTYLLLRNWKVSQPGSFLGGIIFAFSGFNLIWSQWNGHALAAAFIPLILLFVDRWLTLGNVLDGIGISVSLAFLFLSGYPQVAMYLFLAVLLLWLIRIYKGKDKLKRTVFLAVFFILGLGLSAFQLLPGAELLSLSQREVEPHPYEWAFLPWTKIITFVAPDFFGNHATANYWGPQDYTSNTGFVGIVPLVLALFSISLIKRKKEVLFSGVLLVFSLLFAFPTPISIFLWKSGFLGLNAASAHRSLVLFNLAIAILASFGLDYLGNQSKSNFKLKILALLTPFFIIAAFGIWAVSLKGQLIHNIPATTVALRNLVLPSAIFLLTLFIYVFRPNLRFIPALQTGGLVLLTIFELFRFGWKFTPFSPRHIVFPSTPVIDFLKNAEKPMRTTGSRVIPVNMRMPYGIESLEGYDAVYPLRISKLIAAVNSGKSGTDPVGRYGTVDNATSPIMDMVNTKYYLALKKDGKGKPNPLGKIPKDFEEDKFDMVFEDKSVSVLENRKALPRAFVVYDWEIESKETRILDRLLSDDFDYTKKAILEEDVSISRFINIKKEASVSYIRYGANESTIEVTSPNQGLLVVTDTFYPGWRSYVNGKEERIYRANFAFKAIPIKEGKQVVRLSYQPDSFIFGLKVSAVSAGLLALILVANKLLGKARYERYT